MKVLTAKKAALIQRAKELDDTAPDEQCPGCGRTLDDIRNQPGPKGRSEWHTVTGGLFDSSCAWSNDHLVARAMRRRLIRTGDMP